MWLGLQKICCLLVALFILACSSSPPPTPINSLPPPTPAEKPEAVVWAFAPQAIRVYLEAAEDINWLDEESHAVSLCMYQTGNRTALTTKASTSEGLRELLQCKANPPESILATQRYIQPGTKDVFMLDRAEGANFFIAVVGFNDLEPSSCFDSTIMPVHQETTRAWYLFSTDTTYQAAPMDVKIFINNGKVHVKGTELVR